MSITSWATTAPCRSKIISGAWLGANALWEGLVLKLTYRILVPDSDRAGCVVVDLPASLPEEAIRRQLAGLAARLPLWNGRALSAAPLPPKIGRLFRHGSHDEHRAARAVSGTDLAAEISEQAFYLRSQKEIHSFKVKILDPVITLGADNKSAIVELTLHAETEGKNI